MWLVLRFIAWAGDNGCVMCAFEGKGNHFTDRKYLVNGYASMVRIPMPFRWFHQVYCGLTSGHRFMGLDEAYDALEIKNLNNRTANLIKKTNFLLRLAEQNNPPLVETKKGELRLTTPGENFTSFTNLLKKLIDDYWGAVLAVVAAINAIAFIVYKLVDLIKSYYYG